MIQKTYSPYKKFRYGKLYWPNGIRMTSDKELAEIKKIPPEFPIKNASGVVINPEPVVSNQNNNSTKVNQPGGESDGKTAAGKGKGAKNKSKTVKKENKKPRSK